ncbi:MAG TPA: hypothetical protein VED17_03650 [Nitrososphaerales archaeon]|nr:hypothetical protein [Nitrososphaerales archaeon]
MESSSPLSFNQNLSSEISPESETFTSPASAELSVASSNESVLRRQDNVIFRNNRSIQEGVLVLTTKRLVFASGKSIKGDGGVQDILQDRSAYAIPLEQIANVSGNRGILRPSLKVAWHPQPGDPSTTKLEFVQKSSPRTLDDVRNAISEWVPTIDQAARNEIVAPELQADTPSISAQPAINESELRSRVLDDLNDMQWKGFFQISRDLDDKYGTSVDPDALENLCNKLVKEKLIEQDKHGEFFRKISKKK